VNKDGYEDTDEIPCLRPLQEPSASYSLISLCYILYLYSHM